MSERRVTIQVEVDPTKAEVGAKQAADAVNKISQRGQSASGFQLNKTVAQWRASIANAASGGSGSRGGSGSSGASGGGAMAGQKGAVLVRLIESQFRGIMSLRSTATAYAAAGATATAGTDKEVQGFTRSLRAASLAIIGAGAAALGFVAAGNPLLFRTFTGSVQLLGARISELLIPAFISASATIQDWSNIVNSLSPATKEAISAILRWGGAIVLGTVVVSKIIGAFQALATIALGLKAALGPLGTLLGRLAPPIAVGLAGYELFSHFNRPSQTPAVGPMPGTGNVQMAASAGTAASRPLITNVANGGFAAGLQAAGVQGWTMRPGGPTAGPNGQPNRPPMLFSHVQPMQYGSGEEFYNAILTQAVSKAEGDQALMLAEMKNIAETLDKISKWYSGGQSAFNTSQTLGPATAGQLAATAAMAAS